MGRDVLLRCSGPGCAALVWLNGAIRGDEIGEETRGRFCLECARRLGYRTWEDRRVEEATLESLLRDAGS